MGAAGSEDLEELLQRARRGGGGARLISRQALIGLYRLAGQRGMLLDGAEPFRIEGDRQIPYVHLTLNPTEIHESLAHLNWSGKIAEMGRIIETMLAETDKSGGEFRFYAWVSEEADWAARG